MKERKERNNVIKWQRNPSHSQSAILNLPPESHILLHIHVKTQFIITFIVHYDVLVH